MKCGDGDAAGSQNASTHQNSKSNYACEGQGFDNACNGFKIARLETYCFNKTCTQPFKVNSRVCIHSMTTAPQYNHQSGTVFQNFDNGCVKVVLDSDKYSIVIFKPTKLRLK